MTETCDLERSLRQEIAASGPIALSRFMAQAISTYYAGRDPFGAGGDFITAPEISQIFGEIIGLWAAVIWQMMGSPAEVALVELGPGRGTLMADMMRAAAMLPAFAQAARVRLIETSPHLRAAQRQALRAVAVQWFDDVADVPDGPMILVANEFIDALPIDQYVRRADGWHPRLIDWHDQGFNFVDGPGLSADELASLNFPPADLDEIVEVNHAARRLARQLGQRLIRAPGAALLIDYGHAISAPGDSLQAIYRHQAAPPLARPGAVDLTAHVDFAALAAAARPASASPIISQGAFLRRLGIELRAAKLAAARPDQAEMIQSGCLRLINPRGMGTLFKVLALSSPELADLPGFAS